MKNFFSLKRKGEKGFTLIELLVVIGILGILAAVSVPAYNKFFGAGTAEANATDLVSVQAAMDAMMADNGIAAVTAQATGTDVFTALPTEGALTPTYMRKGTATDTTKCEYTWDAAGLVTQGTCN